jgi:hypothetical protein
VPSLEGVALCGERFDELVIDNLESDRHGAISSFADDSFAVSFDGDLVAAAKWARDLAFLADGYLSGRGLGLA